MDRTINFYNDNAADMARRYERVEFKEPVDRVAEFLPGTATVLEIGTGSGRDAARLLAAGYDVIGVDGSAPMIAEAESLHPELEGRLHHHVLPKELPFPDDRFDAVVSWAVLMHLREDDLESVFADIGRVTAAGGMLAYSVNTERAGLDQSSCDERGRRFTCFSVTGWERLHRLAGFETIELTESDDLTGRPGIRWVTVYARKGG